MLPLLTAVHRAAKSSYSRMLALGMAARLLRHREYQGVNTLAQSLSQRSGMPLVLHDEVAEQHASETVVVEKQVGVDCAAAGSPSQSSSPSTVQWLPSPRAIMRGQPTRPRCTSSYVYAGGSAART